MSKSTVFVIRNHENRYLTKKRKWRSGTDNARLFRAVEKDIALNELIETNAHDIQARLELVECEIDNHKHPVVEVLAEDPPEALEEDAKEQANNAPWMKKEDGDQQGVEAGADEENKEISDEKSEESGNGVMLELVHSSPDNSQTEGPGI
jgi:hypothetical protein